MDLGSGAGLLHRLTSYAPERDWDVPVDDPRVQRDLAPNDLDTIPPPVKAYDSSLPDQSCGDPPDGTGIIERYG